jgi:D-tyrosyl-tRNA(Tyr) deacylase
LRLVVQRVSRARVRVAGRVTGEIAAGLLVLAAVGKGDTPATMAAMAEKTALLRIFSDEVGKMNRSLLETGGAVLAISQFTLYGDVRRGRRPGFELAAASEDARPLFEEFLRALRALGLRVETGLFQAEMTVDSANEGPVTILIDSEKLF